MLEMVYMEQLNGFQEKGKEHLMCELKKSTYGLKQVSRQCYLKFDEIMTSLEFRENYVDHYIYMISIASKFVILVLYINDIVLTSDNEYMLIEIKQLLSIHFEMKDLGNAFFVLGIKIHHEKY